MNTFKRILSGILSAAMVVSAASVISVNAANLTFTDVSEHWAWTNGQIPYLVDKGVLNGYEQPNGTYMFKPDGKVKRSEFIKMLDEVFGLTKTTDIYYSDVPANEWYYPYFQKAAAQGYILDYGSTVNPTGEITREEAAALLVRYLNLPADEKADASTFADYTTIKTDYREYVLRAVHAGIINGYSENGKTLFKPQNSLTRAEALTILYRAAGCIFNEGASMRSGQASSVNNTITKSGIAVNNIIFNGRNIISEGAAGDRITFTNCTFNGTLYVRGSAAVTFSDCNIDELVLLGGGDITLVSGSKADVVNVEKTTSITAYGGTKINELNIEYGADFSKVTGEGSIAMANIRAREFASSVIPTEFEIGNNLNAYFDENVFQGSSDAQNAFALEPFSTADDYYYYINMIPNADGRIYYYYTNLGNVPSASAFDSYYNAANQYGSFEVKTGEVVSHETLSVDKVANFDYVVVQLQYDNRKYAPVLVENTGKMTTGFKTEPYAVDETTIKFHAETSGTLYWFYANDGKKLNQLEFLNAYNNKESALKDATDVTSIKSFTCNLKEKYLSNYTYIAFMMVTGANKYHTPVIVSVGNDGFASNPIVKTPGTISFTPSVGGDIYYYYSATADLPAAADFKSVYNSASKKDSDDISRNAASTIKYDLSRVNDYPYMIMAIRDDDGNYFQPVAVDINYTTGFRNDPEVSSATEISFRAKTPGTVKFYYTKNDVAPNCDAFNEAYDDQLSKYKGSLKVNTFYENIDYSGSYASSYPYMAIMFTDEEGKQYSPVLLALDATYQTGFAIAPYAADGYVYFRTKEEGKVYFFYTSDSDAVSPSEFMDYYRNEPDSRKGYFHVSDGTTERLEIDEDLLKKYPYIVFAFTEDTDSSDPDFAFPYVLDVAYSEVSKANSGLKVSEPDSNNRVRVEALYDGILYWYCTDDSDDLPASKNDFESKYSDADSDLKDRIRDFTKGEYENLKFNDCDYLVIALKVDDELLNYVVVHTEKGISSNGNDSGYLGSYDVDTYGFIFEGWNEDGLYVKGLANGTVDFFADGFIETKKNSQEIKAGETITFDVPVTVTDNGIFNNFAGLFEMNFYLQFTDSDGKTYKPYRLREFD